MYNNAILDIDILVNGKPLRQYSHKGKVYIEARQGTQYTLKVRNTSYSRKLLASSVDGINVLDGKPSGDSDNGYIINGSSNIEIKGFRVSDDTVNAFKFAKKATGKTYTQNSDEGDVDNCGVIAFKLFEEKEKPKPKVVEKHIHHHYPKPEPVPQWPWYPTSQPPIWNITTSDNTGGVAMGSIGQNTMRCFNENQTKNKELAGNTVCDSVFMNYCVTETASLAPKQFDMGTEFSDIEINDRVIEVPFEVGRLLESVEIYYASKEVLLSWGIPVNKDVQVSFPNPFPNGKYCKRPNK